jgi:hypothetical protein
VDAIGAVLTVLVVVLLWVAAGLFGRDSRTSDDWASNRDLRDPTSRLGD